ncbi:MAG: hypothetical protein JWM80_6339 [Cyanobacteria bacterium RYN_339]|nr:hypothetical protein [Cyanobacteria bacterium RYN_339]
MNKNIFGAMIASSLVLATLAGCNTPTPGGASATGTTTGGTTGTTTPSKPTGTTTGTPAVTTQPGTTTGSTATASNETSSEAASAMADERAMDDYSAVAEQEDPTPASFYVLDVAATGAAKATVTAGATGAAAVNANAGADLKAAAAKIKAGQKLTDDERRAAIKGAAKVKITVEVKAKVQARIKERNQKIAKRLDKLSNQREKMRNQLKGVKWVDNGDGTQTKTISFDDTRTVNGKSVTRKATISRTIQTDTKALVSWHADFDQTLPNGLHRVSTRDKVLQEDGTYLVTFHSELTLAGGAKRTSDWTKTIAADGSVTGKGTITWANKDGKIVKTVTITLSGDEDTPKCKDDGGKAEVTLPADGDATVITDAGATATVAADSASVDVTADAGATADASASTSADAQTRSGGGSAG